MDSTPQDSPDQQSILVFGGAGGIGSELSKRLASNGHRVTIAGHTEDKLKQRASELGVEYHVVDAVDFAAVDSCVRSVAERGGLNSVVNCVGSLILKSASLTSAADYRDAIDRNLTSAFAVVRSASQVLRKSGGSIVLMSSAAARMGLPNHEAIAAAKAGVIGLTMSAAATLAGANVRVNAVAPGMVKTPLTKSIWSRQSAAKNSQDFHALGRLGEPSDVAAMIAWLLEPSNDWVTGQVFGVDGGLATVSPR